jgi:uroporphyrin-3 C-methyltransferase
MQQALTKQQQNFDKQLQHVSTQIHNASQTKIAQLDANVAQLEQSVKQRQPSDWLLHEAEYLIRIAARTLWLEQDARAAIGLLKDANSRLTELNDPSFLPVRELLHQDIKALEVMPILHTDEVVLTLMAMSKQVEQLPLAVVDLGKGDKKADELELSDDINDWQSNLAKTWQKFYNNFIRIRKRTGSIEPLMSPEQQENLKQNLSLKIQLAIWAASERKGDVYQKSLIDIQQWLNEFFDMKDSTNQHFVKSITSLQQKQVNFDYSNELGSLTAIRVKLQDQQLTPKLTPQKVIENKPQDEATQEPKVDSQRVEDTLEQREQPEIEGSI